MIQVEVSRAYFGHRSAARMVEVARDSMDAGAESLRILRNRYDAGLVTLTEVLRAEDADRQSQTQLLAGRVSQRVELCSAPVWQPEP